MKFKKRPVEIEAFQWMGFNSNFLNEWTNGFFKTAPDLGEGIALIYDELHDTWVKMKLTDWVIKGVQGGSVRFYPCDDDVLEATYEPVDSEGFYRPMWGSKKQARTVFNFNIKENE